MALINGRKIADSILKDIAKKTASIKPKPSLAVILVGNNPASVSFIKQKKRAAIAAGIRFSVTHLPSTVSKETLHSHIVALSKKSPLILQLPLPKKFKNISDILNAVPVKRDADCLSRTCIGTITLDPIVLPPTVAAFKKILLKYRISPAKKKIAIVGMGRLVGAPLYLWLLSQHADVTGCDKYTKNISGIISTADIVISGVGISGFIKGKDIKKSAVLIDYGFAQNKQGKISGDFEFSSCSKKASLITPVPGGMGPLTVACLIENTVKLTN